MKRVFLLVIILGYVHLCLGQGRHEGSDTISALEPKLRGRILESASESIDVLPYLDNLRQLEENPLDISDATASELQQIPGVSAQAAFQIVSYRDRHPIENKNDLRSIQGIEPEVIEALEPYVTFPDVVQREAIRQTLTVRTRVTRKLSQDPAFSAGQYLGTPEKIYNRITGRFSFPMASVTSRGRSDGLDAASVSVGFLTSKDPGEKNYADLVGGNVVVNAPGYFTKLVLGDFLVDGGQGLVFWRPTSIAKGGEATAGVARNGTGVWPSLTSNSAMAFRGVGVNIQPRGAGIHLFYSSNTVDATMDSVGEVTHLSTDDLHRTAAELARSDCLREKTFGGRMTFQFGKATKVGASAFNSQFSSPVALSGPFGFKGVQAWAIGLDVLYSDGLACAFAEVARDKSKTLAAVAGFSAMLRPDITLAFLLRSFPTAYNNFHSSGFSESGDGCKNESGIYAGLSYRPAPWVAMTAYVDQYAFPWRTYGSLMTSQGHEYFLRVDLNVRRYLGLEFQFRQKVKSESQSSFDLAKGEQANSAETCRSTFRAKLRFEPSRILCWRNCVDIVTVELNDGSARERGMLFYQDLTGELYDDLRLSARIVAFHTDSYASRVYEYETDLPGAYATPALSERGFRWYVIGRYRLGRTVALNVKYSQSSKENPEERSGLTDNQVGVQLDFVI